MTSNDNPADFAFSAKVLNSLSRKSTNSYTGLFLLRKYEVCSPITKTFISLLKLTIAGEIANIIG